MSCLTRKTEGGKERGPRRQGMARHATDASLAHVSARRGVKTRNEKSGLTNSRHVFPTRELAAQRRRRDHHPFGFTVWLASGEVKGRLVHGTTDEFGWHAV